MKRLQSIHLSLSMSIIASLFIFLVSCQNAGVRDKNDEADSEKSTLVCDTNYYAKYNDQEIRDNIDEAKWNLYLYAAVDTPKNVDGSFAFKIPKSYASYPLVLDTLYTYSETTFILFSFCIDGELLTDERAFELGVVYVPESISLMRTADGQKLRCVRWRGLADGDNLCITSLSEGEITKMSKHFSMEQLKGMTKSTDRLAYPLNPVVINYIETNQKDLDPWFINEAKKRGIINKW